jgi:hypothetical protein
MKNKHSLNEIFGMGTTGKTFNTWEEYFNYMMNTKENVPSIPYLCYIYYIGGLGAGGGHVSFNDLMQDRPDYASFMNALKGLVVKSFESKSTSFLVPDRLSGNMKAYSIINKGTYDGKYSFSNVVRYLIEDYFGHDLEPEEKVLCTVGSAGIGGKEIMSGGIHHILHPSHNNGYVRIIDTYDFSAFDFVSNINQKVFTFPHKVLENAKPVVFDFEYFLELPNIKIRPDIKVANSIKGMLNETNDSYGMLLRKRYRMKY